MNYYDVRVEVKLLEIVSVKAETREQAITQAKEEFYNGGIFENITIEEYYNGVTFEVEAE